MSLLQELVAALVSLFLVQPLQAEVGERLGAARVPAAIASQVASCLRTAAPDVVSRVTADPAWAISSAVRVWIGSTPPEELLVEVVPGCAGPVTAARPFLDGRSS